MAHKIYFLIFFSCVLLVNAALEYDGYRDTCSNLEQLVLDETRKIINENEKAPAQLLRLQFHDCFIEGCDASVMLNNGNGVMNQSERQTIPNLTLKGFDYIERVKEVIENECPGVVSCADTIVMTTRTALSLSGGPYYPVKTGRRDSIHSFPDKALAELPGPFNNISRILSLFATRGFNERETTALLGAHHIGSIGCEVIRARLQPTDKLIPLNFQQELRKKCQEKGARVDLQNDPTAPPARDFIEAPQGAHMQNDLAPSPARDLIEAAQGMQSQTGGFDGHYYEALKRGRGVLKSDQELTANTETLKAVMDYAADPMQFREDFAAVMLKLSNLNVRVGTDGEVRRHCSFVNSSP